MLQRKDGNKAISENQTTSKKNSKTKGGGAPPSNVIPPAQDADESNQGQHYGKPRWWLILEGLALAAGVAYAVLTYLMWQDSHHNFTIDERAWMNVGINLPNTINEGTPLVAKMTVFNTGKTVSRKILLECVVSRQRNTDPVPFDYVRPHSSHDVGMLTPSALTNLQCSSKEPDQVESLSKQQSDDLMSGRAYLAVYGRGSYIDIFGGAHWVQFCVWKGYFSGNGVYNAKSCTDYNDTGDGEAPK
jgi:hypothetical protein